MRLVRMAAATLNQTPLDWDGNRDRIRSVLQRARAEGATVLCLPELCISGYGAEDAFHGLGTATRSLQVLEELLPDMRGMIVAIGLPLRHRGMLYNATCVLADGEPLGVVAKQHLAGDGLHYEPRWFRAWPAGVRVEATLLGRRVPLGDVVFDVGGLRLGVEICEDAWVAARPGVSLAERALDVMLNPSASHFAFGKGAIRRRLVADSSRAFAVTYLYANLLGNEAGRAIYDGGARIASGGELLATTPRFSFADSQLASALVDVDLLRVARARQTSFDVAVDDVPGSCATSDFDPFSAGASLSPERASVQLPDWERGAHVKEEEFARAISLALVDYLRKSRSRGFVVSLSGGADSSACAALVHTAVQLASSELGGDALAARLGIDATPAELMPQLLTCVYQATQNSSERTQMAARTLAEAVSADFHVFDVQALVDGYSRLVEQALGRELSWERDDIALQNIQARVRAPSVWMLANVRGALLLATSNRSEAAVGYATMDGDTCGGISPLAGIDKAFLLRWLRWLETTGPAACGPLPALSAVTALTPTAELRPESAAQTDEADLMPYPVLDAVERAAIRDKRTPAECLRVLATDFPDTSDEQRRAWVTRFFLLWSRNQWKRERYAPSFHVDDANLDPKTWCRFPILSGGFARELAEIRDEGKA